MNLSDVKKVVKLDRELEELKSLKEIAKSKLGKVLGGDCSKLVINNTLDDDIFYLNDEAVVVLLTALIGLYTKRQDKIEQEIEKL